MRLSSFYPVIATKKLKESSQFYTSYFPFVITFENEWYVSLITREEPRFQLAFVNPNHPSVPEGFQVDSAGIILNFELENVDAEYKRFKESGLPIHVDLRSEDWGQRHFITSDPNGLLIDVIQLTPPAPEFAADYSPEALAMMKDSSQRKE